MERRSPVQSLLRAAVLIATPLWAACTGSVGSTSRDDDKGNGGGRTIKPGGDGIPEARNGLGRLDDDEVAACQSQQTLDPGPALYRRLNRREFDNTVADLLSDPSGPARDFPTDERRLSFDNNAAFMTVSPRLAENYQSSAEKLARAAVERGLDALVPCEPTAEGCGRQFVESFGERAFRRPLAKDEVDTFMRVFAQGLKTDFKHAVEMVIETALQSAPFLYRVEVGEPQDGTDYFKVTPWEMASRVSYLLWASMPDDELFAAARSGALADRDEVARQVERMMDDPRARRNVGNFHEQWLGLADVVSLDKDAAQFPGWKNDHIEFLKAETRAFTEEVLMGGESLKTLLTAEYTHLDGKAATHYGEKGVTGNDFRKFTLDDGIRSGVLTQGSVMAATAKPDQTSPILRGKFVREHLLCETLPPPPPEVDNTAPDVDPSKTTRERFNEHSANPACGNCHQLLDPLGWGLENFDPVGRFRADENGHEIDANGEIHGTDAPGTFTGATELGNRLAGSQDVQRCMVTSWFRFAYGRTESETDLCFLHQLDARFGKSQGNLKDLVVAMTQIDAFFNRRAGDSQ
jgi:hypothetical protein